MMRMPEQAVQPAARRKRNRSANKESVTARVRSLSPASLRQFTKPAGVVVLLILFVGAYKPIVSSSLFDLKHVIVQGNMLIPASQAEALVRQVMGSHVYGGRLDDVRQAFKQQPLIKDVVVARLLPDTLRLVLIERKPIAVVRLSRGLVCIDEDGKVVGDFSLMGAQPTLMGWDERTLAVSRAANLTRLRLYEDLKRALSQMKRNYWDELVNEVDVGNVDDVVINLKQSPITQIHLGDRDFARRFRSILNILDDVLQGRLSVSYINVSDPSRVVVRSTQSGERTQPTHTVKKERGGA